MDNGNRDFQVNDLVGRSFSEAGRCFGLAREVFRRQGIEIPDYGGAVETEDRDRINRIVALLAAGEDWTAIQKPVRGCLVVLRFPYPKWVSHVGVMLDGDRFVNARRKTGVVVDRISSPAWKKRIAGFYLYKGSRFNGSRFTVDG